MKNERKRLVFLFVCFLKLFILDIFFNACLLQTYIHGGAPEDMRHWYSQHFISHKHGMNEQNRQEKER